eukprot:5387971-Prymnesium_polylepis.1
MYPLHALRRRRRLRVRSGCTERRCAWRAQRRRRVRGCCSLDRAVRLQDGNLLRHAPERAQPTRAPSAGAVNFPRTQARRLAVCTPACARRCHSVILRPFAASHARGSAATRVCEKGQCAHARRHLLLRLQLLLQMTVHRLELGRLARVCRGTRQRQRRHQSNAGQRGGQVGRGLGRRPLSSDGEGAWMAPSPRGVGQRSHGAAHLGRKRLLCRLHSACYALGALCLLRGLRA